MRRRARTASTFYLRGFLNGKHRCITDSGHTLLQRAIKLQETVISLSPCGDPNHIRLSGKIFDTIDLMSSIAPYIQDVNPKVVKQARSRLTLAETLAFSKLPLGHKINESSSIAARCQRYAEGYFAKMLTAERWWAITGRAFINMKVCTLAVVKTSRL